MRRFIAKLKNLFRYQTAERELAREVASHLALLEEDFRKRGLNLAASARGVTARLLTSVAVNQ
jgi:hypothetical protein